MTAVRPVVDWVHDERHAGLRVARTRLPDPRSADRSLVGWGRDTDARRALAMALSEVAERHALHTEVPLGRLEPDPAGRRVPASEFVGFAPDQLAARDDLCGVDEGQGPWVHAREWLTGNEAWVPAECVHARACLPGPAGRKVLMRPTSSGCAADANRDVAVQRAAWEVIERDAIARHWLAQAPGTGVDPRTLPETIASRVAALQALGVDASVLVLHLGLGPVVAVLAGHAGLGFACLGAAAASTPAEAVRRAWAEAEFAARTRCAGEAPHRLRPEDATTPRDHGDLFATRAHWRRATVLGGRIGIDFPGLVHRWRDLPSRLQELQPGSSHAAAPDALYAIDLTMPETPAQMDGTRIRVMRALIPGCVPLAYGWDALPRAMVPFEVGEAGRFPHPLG